MHWKVYTSQSPEQNLLVATVHPSHKKRRMHFGICCRVCPLWIAAETAKVSVQGVMMVTS